MAARYRLWGRHGSVRFIYLSKGPWCYRSRVLRFLRTNRFPAGCVELNPHFPIAFTGYKRAPIARIIRAHPGCAFVLVGDSGEDDPEVYGQIAASLPDNGCRIFIRDITPRGPSRRFSTAFAHVPRTRWQLFARASQLPATPLDRSTKLPLSHVHASPTHRR
jgi:phosphatidate phosphatase APP1